jgi:hypothetical protein
MADQKVSALPLWATVNTSALLMVVDSTTGTGINYKSSIQSVVANLTVVTTNTSIDYAAVEAVLQANVAHPANEATAIKGEAIKQSAVTGNAQYGVYGLSQLTANANIVSMCAGVYAVLDPGTTTATSSNALAVLVIDAKQTGTRGTAPSAFISLGEFSANTQPVKFVMDIGRPGYSVSGNNSTVNASAVLSSANSTTVTHKLAVRVNSQNFWICLANTV